MMPRDAHSFRIDVASDDRATQALRGGNRQDAAAGPDIQWPAKAAAPRQSVQGKQAAAGRGMLAGAERRRRVDLNRDRRGRCPAMPMRTVDEKTPDALRRKIAAVLGEPIALRQTLLDNVQEPAAGAGGG